VRTYFSLPSLLVGQFFEDVRTLTFKAVSPSAGTVLLNVAEHGTLEVLKGLDGRSVTADEVSLITKRARAVECMYLNVLHRRGLLLKKRENRKVLFTLKEEIHSEGQTVDT
jgi:hypothetical protein